MSVTGEHAGPTATHARPASPTPAAARRLQRVSISELLVAWALLGILAVAAFGPHAREGGFSLDDWSNGVGALQTGGFDGAIAYFADLTAYRPVLILYVPLIYELFGTRMGWHLAWAAAIGLSVSCLLYAILRTLRMARVHASLIAALVLIFPWFDSTRFWATASQVSLGVALAFAGLWAALTGLRRGAARWHIVAVALYATSILTYEIALALIGAFGVVYVAAAGWKAARRRWAADLVVVLAGVAWVGTQTKRDASGGMSAYLEHLEQIVRQGGELLGRAAWPLGQPRTTLALVTLLAIAVVGVVTWRRDRDRAPTGTAMTPWLLLGAAGVAIAALGWVLFIPADPYYTPSVYGFTNRVNGLAGIGLVMTVYAALGIVGALVGRLAKRTALAATAATAALAVALGVAYKSVIERHGDIWTTAFRAQMAGLGQMKTQFPTLPDGTTVYIAGYPAHQTLGVPIFSTTWDVNGAVKLQYRNPTLQAFPILPGTRFACSRGGVTMLIDGDEVGGFVPYGSARFLDIPTGRHATPRDARECRRQAPRFQPGPFYLDYEY